MRTQVEQQEAGSEKQTLSSRKVQANRQNALKSTGPRTARGKAHSCRNALKQGLFALDLYVATITEWEDPDKYQTLLSQLAEDFMPLAAAEELEVQRIASCWWRLSRVWQYENAQIASDLFKKQVLLNQPERLSPEDEATYLLLKTLQSEIEATGKIPNDFEGELQANDRLRKLWKFAEKEFIELLAAHGVPSAVTNKIAEASPDVRTQLFLATCRHASYILGREYVMALAEAAKLAHAIAGIPDDEVLARVHRADAAAERSLDRAVNRLDRLQRRRLGEAVPPPVTVRLTR